MGCDARLDKRQVGRERLDLRELGRRQRLRLEQLGLEEAFLQEPGATARVEAGQQLQGLLGRGVDEGVRGTDLLDTRAQGLDGRVDRALAPWQRSDVLPARKVEPFVVGLRHARRRLVSDDS